MSHNFSYIPALEGVRKVAFGEGEKFDVAGAHLVWKVRGEESAYNFSVCEMTLAPGEGVPLHSHTSAESFYVISGRADFFRLNDGKENWVRCEPGDVMILPPNSLHGFYNKGTSACRLLGISTAVHQTFFDAVAEAEREKSFSSLPPEEAMGKIAQIALNHHMYFAPVDISKA
jgi:quercetin dioxygenase-like cupin family protein